MSESESEDLEILFNISIDGLYETVIDDDIVCIKCDFNCGCVPLRKTEYYICRKEIKNITNQDLIDCLVYNGFIPCKWHTYLKNFLYNSPAQVTPFFDNY